MIDEANEGGDGDHDEGDGDGDELAAQYTFKSIIRLIRMRIRSRPIECNASVNNGDDNFLWTEYSIAMETASH